MYRCPDCDKPLVVRLAPKCQGMQRRFVCKPLVVRLPPKCQGMQHRFVYRCPDCDKPLVVRLPPKCQGMQHRFTSLLPSSRKVLRQRRVVVGSSGSQRRQWVMGDKIAHNVT